jgi:hypothetical protein
MSRESTARLACAVLRERAVSGIHIAPAHALCQLGDRTEDSDRWCAIALFGCDPIPRSIIILTVHVDPLKDLCIALFEAKS